MDEAEAARVATGLLSTDGVRNGICAHVGCGDGRLTAALHQGGRYLVLGLDPDPRTVARAREHIRAKGLYGRVSVDRCSFSRLPWTDHLVNVLVADDLPGLLEKGFSISEAMRVLAPHGTLFLGGADEDALSAELERAGVREFEILKENGVWAKVVKPFPAEMDEWRQDGYDASGTAISKDRLAGVVTGVRWVQGHFWSPLFRPLMSIVSANGRTFYLKRPEPGSGGIRIEARDAFNGLKLWERVVGPVKESQHPVVAAGDLVFTHLKADGPVVALDAATGEVARTYEVGGEISFYRGRLIAREEDNTWTALDPLTGRKLRRFTVKKAEGAAPILIAEGRILMIEAGPSDAAPKTSMVCRDFDSGGLKWKAPNVGDGRLFWVRRGIILTQRSGAKEGGIEMNAFSAADGRHLWRHESTTKKGGKTAAFYMKDYIWAYGASRWYSALDPRSGRVVTSDRGRWKEFGRCGPDNATERYVLGMDFSIYDFEKTRSYDCFIARADCDVGYIPAAGLYYAYGHQCRCGVYLSGVIALSSAPLPSRGEMSARAGAPFEEGPAYGMTAPSSTSSPEDWPTFRHDPFRSGVTRSALPAALKTLWKTKVAGRISSPVIARGTAFVAAVDEHRVVAMDAETGRVLWDFTAGARIDSPPTIRSGRALFGSRDGWVYCLKASTGELVWRFRAAPEDRRISVRGQVESVWPVFGAVLVENDVAYFAAGRHGDADGGIFLYAVEPASGRVLWRENIRGFPPYRTDPTIRLIESRKIIPAEFSEEAMKAVSAKMQQGMGHATLNDVLMSDGRTIFLGALGIDIRSRKVGVPSGVSIYTAGQTMLTDNTMPKSTARNLWAFEGKADAPAWRTGKSRLLLGNLLAADDRLVYGIRHRYAGDKRTCVPRLFAFPNPAAADKGAGPEPGKPPSKVWNKSFREGNYRLKAMVVAGGKVFVGCQPGGAVLGSEDRNVGEITVHSAKTGRQLASCEVGAAPLFDGMAAARGRLYVSTQDGHLICLERRTDVAAADAALESTGAVAASRGPVRINCGQLLLDLVHCCVSLTKALYRARAINGK